MNHHGRGDNNEDAGTNNSVSRRRPSEQQLQPRQQLASSSLDIPIAAVIGPLVATTSSNTYPYQLLVDSLRSTVVESATVEVFNTLHQLLEGEQQLQRIQQNFTQQLQHQIQQHHRHQQQQHQHHMMSGMLTTSSSAAQTAGPGCPYLAAAAQETVQSVTSSLVHAMAAESVSSSTRNNNNWNHHHHNHTYQYDHDLRRQIDQLTNDFRDNQRQQQQEAFLSSTQGQQQLQPSPAFVFAEQFGIPDFIRSGGGASRSVSLPPIQLSQQENDNEAEADGIFFVPEATLLSTPEATVLAGTAHLASAIFSANTPGARAAVSQQQHRNYHQQQQQQSQHNNHHHHLFNHHPHYGFGIYINNQQLHQQLSQEQIAGITLPRTTNAHQHQHRPPSNSAPTPSRNSNPGSRNTNNTNDSMGQSSPANHAAVAPAVSASTTPADFSSRRRIINTTTTARRPSTLPPPPPPITEGEDAKRKRKEIQNIMKDTNLSQQEKNHFVQQLMSGRAVPGLNDMGNANVQSKNTATTPATSSSRPPCTNPSGMCPCQFNNANNRQLPASRRRLAFTTEQRTTRSSDKKRPADAISQERKSACCPHYDRTCHIVAPCCGQVYGCDKCHDEDHDDDTTTTITKKKHVLMNNSVDVKQIVCRTCSTRQDASNKCVRCSTVFAEYYCSDCKIWASNDAKPFHCSDCGICRYGNCKFSHHCDDCNMCIPTMVFGGAHKCIPDKYKSNCPICLEDLFTTTRQIADLPCGHPIHLDCVQAHVRQDFRCPLCKKTVLDEELMKVRWNILKRDIVANPLPQHLQRKVAIYCHDCQGKYDQQTFHYLGVPCPGCESFNTTTTYQGPRSGNGTSSSDGNNHNTTTSASSNVNSTISTAATNNNSTRWNP